VNPVIRALADSGLLFRHNVLGLVRVNDSGDAVPVDAAYLVEEFDLDADTAAAITSDPYVDGYFPRLVDDNVVLALQGDAMPEEEDAAREKIREWASDLAADGIDPEDLAVPEEGGDA
jgi:hypothetical protein